MLKDSRGRSELGAFDGRRFVNSSTFSLAQQSNGANTEWDLTQ